MTPFKLTLINKKFGKKCQHQKSYKKVMANKTLAEKYCALGEGHTQVVNFAGTLKYILPTVAEKDCELKTTAIALWNFSKYRKRL